MFHLYMRPLHRARPLTDIPNYNAEVILMPLFVDGVFMYGLDIKHQSHIVMTS